MKNKWIEIGSQGVFTRESDPGRSARPLVLVHGQVVSSRYLVPLAEEMEDDFAVYMPDLPGFGKSAKPPHTLTIPELADSLAAWMDAIGLEQTAIFGNSFGCQIITEFAVRHPERLTRIVFQGPTVDPWARTIPEQGIRWLIDCTRESPSFALVMAHDFLAAGGLRSWKTFQSLLRDRIEAKLPDVEAPTLVVRGSRDPLVTQRWAKEAAGLLPNGRLRILRGAPHAINYTAPARLARAIRPFLQGNSSSVASR